MSVELVYVVLVVRFPLWCWFLPLPFLLSFLRESTCICHHLHSFHFQMTRSDSLQSFERSNTTATRLLEERHCWDMHQLQTVSKKNRGHIHHHCVLDCICQRSSRSTFPLSDVQLQDLSPDSKPSVWTHQGFNRHHDLLHQGILSILSVWRVSTVYLSPCLSSVCFLHGSDHGSYTPFRYQSQCTIHLHATLQVCFTSALTAAREIGFRSISHLSISS